MSGRILLEPTGEPTSCQTPYEDLPSGTIWLCDCGRIWTKNMFSGVGWSSYDLENTVDQRLLRLERWKDKP